MIRQLPNGAFSVDEAEKIGVSRSRLSALVKVGELERLARGVYSKPGEADISLFEAVVLAKRGIDFVLSLESALQVHGMTSALPHALWVSMRRGARRPAVGFPLEIVRVSDAAYEMGVEEHEIGGEKLRVTSVAKTVADLFKFRGRVGLGLAIEALKVGLRGGRFSTDELMRCAEADRVKRVVLPYVEGYFE